MRGYLKKRGDNTYVIAISQGHDPATGKRKRLWETFHGGSTEAKKRLTELLRLHDTGMMLSPGKVTVEEYLKKWLQDYAKHNLSPRGFERYWDIIRQHLIPALGNIKLAQLKAGHIQKAYAASLEAGLSPRTVRYHHAVLHIALKTAMKWGLVTFNAADAVEPPKIRRVEMQVWDEEDVSRFLSAAKDSPYYELFYTALFTGMRRSELLGMSWASVDLIFGQIQVTRGLHHLKDGSYVFTEPKSAKSRRTIALPPSLALVLKEHRARQQARKATIESTLKDSDLVFCDIDWKPWRPNTITRAWVTLSKKSGLKPIRLHDARHTHASLLLKQGVHPKVCQERLGHSSIEMTINLYSHVAPGIQEAAARRFDDLVAPKAEQAPILSDWLQNGCNHGPQA